MKLLSYVILMMVFISCTQEVNKTQKTSKTTSTTSTSSSSSSGSTTGLGGSTTGSSGGGSTTSGGGLGQGSTCYGNSNDGQGSGNAILSLDLAMAGHQNWFPGLSESGHNLQIGDFVTLNEAKMLFSSDSRLRVRFKLNAQPSPTKGMEYCYGRQTGMSPDTYKYDKIKLTVYLRDVVCSNVSPSNPSVCNGTLSLGNRYNPQYLGPFDECSDIIELDAIRNPSPFGTVIEVADVQSDSKCQFSPNSTTYCPTYIVHAGMCWHLTMQIVTDYTQDFK